MPTAEIIKTIDLPSGKRRHFILVDFAADKPTTPLPAVAAIQPTEPQ